MDSVSTRGRRLDSRSRTEAPRRSDGPLRRPDANLRPQESVLRRPTLAIDLGTAGSCAMLVTPERDILVEDPDGGAPVWPSCVAHDGTGPRVGIAAEGLGRVHPDRFRGQLKQLLGEPGTITLGEASFRPVELVSWLLELMRTEAERLGGNEATRAVLTVPVGFVPGDARREALLQAARMAGLGAVELIFEPVATVAAPIVGGPLNAGDIVLVCDFGAGALNGTLVSLLKNGAVELLGHESRPECGGLEIDRLLATELLTRVGRSWSDLVFPTEDPQWRSRSSRAKWALEQRARGMKHQLSAHDHATELIGPAEDPVELTRADLNALVTPTVLRAVDSFRAVLSTAGVRPGELAGVLLSGGGSRMPLVENLVAETFHRPVRQVVDQQRAAVEGAARFARMVERRHIRARVALDRETPLRWDIPGGQGSELQWLLPAGARFGATEPLAVIRLSDGALWELRSGRAGTLVRIHAPDGATVASGDWLVTVELDVRPFR